MVPERRRERPVFTDFWAAYGRFFAPSQHTACDKGSGKTSLVEAGTHWWVNTRWRQRRTQLRWVPGLVRRVPSGCCGVCWRMMGDLTERFLILADRHNRRCARLWEIKNGKQA